MTRMTNRRDTSITLECSYCGEKYNPWRTSFNKKNASKYCSKACRSRAVVTKINSRLNADIEPMPLRIAIHATEESSVHTGEEIGNNWRESGEYWQKVAVWFSNRQAAERKRRVEKDSAYNTLANEGRQIVLTGFNSRLNVKRGNLIIHCGSTYSTESPQEETLYKGVHGVSGIIWITNGHSGNLSIDALTWCSQQNIVIRMITNRGELLATIYPSPDAIQALGIPKQENGRVDVKLRRAQYALQPSGKDTVLARHIILRKLYAQKECLDKHSEIPDRNRGYNAIAIAVEWLSTPQHNPSLHTVDAIRLYEARAANAYFLGMRGLQLKLDDKANKNWPNHWKVIAERNSPLTRFMSARLAVCPFNAMLNYTYALLESQVRSALNAIGADLSCGIVHGDKENRDSLVFDIIEPLRGEVDSMLLDFIKAYTFGAGDFNTTQSGSVTIHPILCKVLAQEVRLKQRRVDDEARFFRTEIFKLMQ